MSSSSDENLPALESTVPAWLVGIPQALVPSSLKAFDRLIGAAVDYPVALIKRQTAKIEAQTKAFEIVESAIAKSAGEMAGQDSDTISRALAALVRKEYRKQTNRESVAAETIEELKADRPFKTAETISPEPPNEDWLNVFERYAEDASTERMQGLWGRVLAGEIRKPGTFSLRTLRFLSEFSQSDAVLLAEICTHAVGKTVLKSLTRPDGRDDIQHLMQLEAAGLLSGATGSGLRLSTKFDEHGHIFLNDRFFRLVFRGEPNTDLGIECYSLTQLGVEFMSLIPGREVPTVMRKFAEAARSPQIKAAFIGLETEPTQVKIIETIWDCEVAA